MRNAAATARGALLEEAAKRLGVDEGRLTVADGVVSGGGKRVTYGELIGGKSFSLKLDHTKPAQAEGPEGLQGRRQVGAARRHPRQGHRPLHLHARLPRARHAARPRGASAGDRRHARKRRRRPRSRTSPASSRSCARAISSASSRRANGPRSRPRRQLKADWSKPAGAARAGQALRARARHQGRCSDEVTSNVGNAAAAMARGRRQDAERDLRLRHPHPRLDRPVLRGRRVQGRQADLVVGLAGDPRPAQAARRDVRHVARRRALHLSSRAPAATAATATRTPPPTPRCWRKRSAGRCACNGRAPTSTAGIRRARRR